MTIKAIVLVAIASAAIICGAIALHADGGHGLHSLIHAIHGRR